MRKIAFLSITFLLSLGAAFAADVPQAGQPAPAVALPSQDGTPVSLKEFSGKWVVLYFYPKDMTQGCIIEAHNFQRDLAKYDQANAVILGVSVDSVDARLGSGPNLQLGGGQLVVTGTGPQTTAKNIYLSGAAQINTGAGVATGLAASCAAPALTRRITNDTSRPRSVFT